MPPRFAFWTIILDGQPTAFRARERETLLPTLRQLQSKNPDAVMKWFARGRLWESPEEARRQPPITHHGRRATERRGPDWRPGGQHVDSRFRAKDRPAEPRRPHRPGEKPPAMANRQEGRKPPRPPGPWRPGEPRGNAGKKPRRSS
jgi:hypothetical protein